MAVPYHVTVTEVRLSSPNSVVKIMTEYNTLRFDLSVFVPSKRSVLYSVIISDYSLDYSILIP